VASERGQRYLRPTSRPGRAERRALGLGNNDPGTVREELMPSYAGMSAGVRLFQAPSAVCS
jgi:hypothetical protein